MLFIPLLSIWLRHNIASPLAKDDLLLCALFGGGISGVGSGLAIRFGGAMDGIDPLAYIIISEVADVFSVNQFNNDNK